MTYEELGKYCKSYVNADREHKGLLEKYFPTIWEHGRLTKPITVLTKNDIELLKAARLKADKSCNEWHKAIIEYTKSRK